MPGSRAEAQPDSPGAPFGSTAEEDDGGSLLAAGCKEGGEVGVGRDEHTLLFACPAEHLFVARGLQPAVAEVDRVVTGCNELLGDKRRQRAVDQ